MVVKHEQSDFEFTYRVAENMKICIPEENRLRVDALTYPYALPFSLSNFAKKCVLWGQWTPLTHLHFYGLAELHALQ